MKSYLVILATVAFCFASSTSASLRQLTTSSTKPPLYDRETALESYKTHDEPAYNHTIIDSPDNTTDTTPTPTHANDTTTSPTSSSSGNGTQDTQEDWWTPQRHVQHAIRAGHVQARAVNLGGWLVAEWWMTPSAEMFQGLDASVAGGGEQAAFSHFQNNDLATEKFQSFRNHFISEQEIAKIAAAGLNTVRVPVGYWIVGFDQHDISGNRQWTNYASGGLALLDRLITDWAKKYNVAVLISMHGAKGSQNGADHSAPEKPGKSYWSQYPENVASTLAAVKFLAARYKHEEAFLGIGLLNEPSGDTKWQVLYKFYEDAYWAIRHVDQNDCILTIAPLLWEQSPAYMTHLLPGATNVWVEWHVYFVWGWEHTSAHDILNAGIERFRNDVRVWKQRSNKKMFIGEFSLATAGKLTDSYGLAEFARRQLSVLLETVDGGWAFWSWRVYGDEYGANPWSLRSLIERGIFPTLPTNQ